MKLPDVVKIGLYTFRVVQDQAAIDRQAVEQRQTVFGTCDFGGQTLYLEPKMAPDCEADTLWHEIKHAVTRQVGVAGRHDSDVEEDFVNSTAALELQVLRDNPKLRRYLFGPSN